ncbi:MAG: type II toxin-antitoxin system RelE/ParE family toxin [Verrucomicrobia bacterium]|nr:type II toxin-antitoxin system RelE/ParE family toxin [Verrucomicrobiota bacterium]MCH8510263.1 type II toxin-antitoxin system RelE/ParE family toxin [Kiritimatiellia bacterium]
MMEIRKTDTFARWLDRLKDPKARAKVLVRISRLAIGNPGDVKPVGKGVSEMRIPYGPGYRVYFVQQGNHLIILLAGGSKRTQSKDIQNAINLMENLEK